MIGTTRNDRKRLRAAGRWSVRLTLFTLAVLVTSAIVAVVVLPRAIHGSALTVVSGSMTPNIPVGSAVIVRPVDPQTLRAGDIATYQVEEGRAAFITHRIVKVHDTQKGLSFTFKGDANRGRDPERVPAGAIRGAVWFHVPYLGAIRDGLHGRGGLTLLATLLLAGYALTQLSAGFRERKSGGSAGTKVERADDHLTIGKTLILAEFTTESAEEPPDVLAHRWAALLIDSNDSTFTLLIAPPAEGLIAALDLLESQQPVRLQVWEAPVVLQGTASEDLEPEVPVTRGRHVAT